MAPLYIPFAPGSNHRVEAELILPAVPANKSWYANWVMIVGQANNSAHPVFFQAGEIRRPGVYHGEHVFIAWQGATDKHVVYRDLNPLGQGMHNVAIVEKRNTFTAFVDGKPVGFSMKIPMLKPYAQIGPEVYAQGDTLSGTVEKVRVSANGRRTNVDPATVCHYKNHGVALSHNGSTFIASGTFDQLRESGFTGECAGIPT
ncbi:MAG: hypothetical protein ACYDHD_02840 [Vulcanimicrobiaceae bacterium]